MQRIIYKVQDRKFSDLGRINSRLKTNPNNSFHPLGMWSSSANRPTRPDESILSKEITKDSLTHKQECLPWLIIYM